MTTLIQSKKHNWSGFIAGLILLLVGMVFMPLMTGQVIRGSAFAAIKPIPEIKYQPHAFERHGADALAIRQCLTDKDGADEIWRSLDKKTFFLWCQLPDGRWGFMSIIQDVIDRLWYENTSFIKGDGTRNALLNYLEKFGTKFNGPYPWQ